MRKAKPRTSLVNEYPLTKEERDVLNKIQKDAQHQMLRFINKHVLSKLKDIDTTKYTYRFRYDQRHGKLKIKRIEQHRALTKDNAKDELGWG